MVLQTWGDVIFLSLQETWTSVIVFLPRFIGALIIFLIGLVVAAAIGKIAEQIIRALRVDSALKHLEVNKFFDRAGWRMDAGMFVGELVKWFLIVVFLLASTNILGLSQVSDFLRDVLTYIPNVVVAAIILVIAALVADVVERLVRGSVTAAGYRGAMVGLVSRWAIWVFAFLAVLLQLGIAAALVQTVITGFVAAVALAVGLAFGLGGRDVAAGFLEKMRSELRR